ncbi:hypothetical protein JMJ35_010667 [Cladonia borealis]|uniref:DUF7924 domain-containing protein n=1 Tax=Cladonia borealis TaxID=184061 RepID=A0AA39UX70_9LECA|nr:hypothetical protein JMJ35_010667 [Cladonia borealis]
MGKRYYNDTTGPLSPLNDAIVIHQVNELMLLLAYQVLPQSTPLDPQPNPTISTPPSRSPSPLSLSPPKYHASLIPTPADGDHAQESDSSDSHSECSEANSESSEPPWWTMTVSKVRSNLASKRFYYDDEDALERCGQEIKDRALEIMRQQRLSPTSKANAPSLKAAIKRYSSTTERTLVNNVWCILKQNPRNIIDEASPKDDDKAMAWVKRAWEMDFVDCVFESDLIKDSIPDTSYTGNETTDAIFKDLPRIEQPRPDVTYGLWKEDLSSSLCAIFDTYHCDLAKGIYLPFFIVEVKTQDVVAGEAENQCVRGGASVVNAVHQWNRVAAGKTHFEDMTAKQKTDERNEFAAAAEKARQDHDTLRCSADPNSFVFSLALSPPTATMHVHWREVREDGVENWHAHTVDTYPLRLDLEPYERLNMHMSNILDWGCTKRRMEIEEQAKVVGKRKWPTLNEEDVYFAPNKRQKLK